ncbi:pentatricopeptide repeat-containing protein At3g20730 isoform X4 [Argentina anserina]|uniref:pentatricopeptide repeat-containing protein At3g20730 isoform X4 n=1 Tax=Argentina anserina TaxID=57926 RepID=UPI0021764A8B|nr:pentatricopeptide repeat-containing protein At3g20730 isoform X4 [Potentilla anserina]
MSHTMQALWKRSHLQEALGLVQSNSTHSDHYYGLYMKILQLCIDERVERPGLLVHTHVITNGFASSLHLNTKLINFYCTFGHVVSAGKVFDKMPERNVVSWTSMLSGYAQSGRYEKALGVFLEMRRAGLRANQFGYGSALKACTGLRALRVGMQIQGCVLKGRFAENLFVTSALVDLHAKCGKMEDASSVFEAMSERDLVSWNAIIGGYAVQGFSEDSLRMFRSMMREGMLPDCFTFGSVLRVLAGDSGLVRISQMHGLIMQLGFGSHESLSGSLINGYAKCGKAESAHRIYRSMIKKDIICCTALITGYAREAMGNALVDMYAKCGEIEDASHAFEEMEEKNVISWTSLISGYGRNGRGEKAIALYKRMDLEGLKPNDVTFLSLLFACSHTGLTNEGWECFNTMLSKYNILPRAKHFSCLVDLCARAGLLEDAHNLIQDMNIKPNASLWGAILGACSTYGNKSLGKVAAMHLRDIDPEKSVDYVVLGSIYAASGAWDNALETRGMVDKRSMKKEPAHSLLQSTTCKSLLLQPS